MKQFCKNQRSRSKGPKEKRNNKIKSKALDPRNYVGRDAGRRFSAGSGGEIPPVGLYGEDKNE